MSQDLKKEVTGERGNTRQASNMNNDRKIYEGFEGMNYEQVREPYNPQGRSKRSNREDVTNENDAGAGKEL
jgi:hypothetical protein